MKYNRTPSKQGLYDPQFEHDSCGVGFVCNIKGDKSNRIIKQALEVLKRLSHRGATGADPKTGDGAGILIQIPHEFFMKACLEAKIKLAAQGEYGAGLVFLPTDKAEQKWCKDCFARIIKDEGQILLGWRSVPVDNSGIGKSAKETQPIIEQIFIGRGKGAGIDKNELAFERKLYVIRKQIENAIRASGIKQKSLPAGLAVSGTSRQGFFYITNLSCRTFSYKGLHMPGQLEDFFLDLKDESIKSALAAVHSRYSTNTFPTWDLAQPFRFLAHNGEINTLRGNINWMRAREGLLKSKLFSKDLKKIPPVIVPGGSDSAALDNIFELLVLAGRPIEQAISMLIPAAWEQNTFMEEKLKDFYRYHACLIEPWDDPAAIAFTNGTRIGAVLDRNGLRPARYIVTKQDFVVLSSETGVLDIKPQDIAFSGRLEPGKMFFIDTAKGQIIEDNQIKELMSVSLPYSKWLKKNMIELDNLPIVKSKKKAEPDILTAPKVFGYTREDFKFIIKPMAEKAQKPVGSMGNDTSPAVLSQRPQVLFNYFKQLFAQDTNPAIDPIREELVMSLETYLGAEQNILDASPEHCCKLKIKNPILTDKELDKIRKIKRNGFKTQVISLLFPALEKRGLRKVLDRICKGAMLAIKNGATFIILSDRGINKDYAAIPSLLAMAAVHHYLIKKALRTQVGIVIESAEPREVHHFALLFGYGADCINPYLAYQAIELLAKDRELSLDLEGAIHNYIKAMDKGIAKILSKMGISTLQSYRGAQIFEALGISQEVIDTYFPGTPSRIGGVSLEIIAQEVRLKHL